MFGVCCVSFIYFPFSFNRDLSSVWPWILHRFLSLSLCVFSTENDRIAWSLQLFCPTSPLLRRAQCFVFIRCYICIVAVSIYLYAAYVFPAVLRTFVLFSIRRCQSNHLSNKFFFFSNFPRGFYMIIIWFFLWLAKKILEWNWWIYICALFDIFVCLAGTTPEISTPKGPATGRTITFWANGPSSANCCLISRRVITDRLWPEAEEA